MIMSFLTLLKLLIFFHSFIYITTAGEKLRLINKNDHTLVFPLKLSNTSTSLSINLTSHYFINQLYGIYFEATISNEIFDINNKLKYKHNINKQNGQFLSFKMSLDNNNSNILIYENRKVNQKDLKFFSTVLIDSNNLSLSLDFKTYLKNFAWNYRSFNKIININAITVFPLSKNINMKKEKGSIENHHYDLLMKFFSKNMDVFDYQDGISFLFSNEFTKRNYNENTLNWMKYTFVIGIIIYGIFQVLVLLYCKKVLQL